MRISSYNKAIRYFVYSLILSISVGCTDTKKQISDNINVLTKHNVIVPYDKIKTYKGHYACYDYSMSEPLSLIIYVDSLECSSCYLGTIDRWEPLLDSLRMDYNFIRTTILLSPTRKNQPLFFEKLKYTKFKYPLYIDTCNIFALTNKYIPENKMFHTFLLDENNKVILVGDPLRNKKIKDMLYKILKQRKESN